MIRRVALERAGGYEAVKDEVAEDLRMAELLKGAGQHLHIAYAPGLAATACRPTCVRSGKASLKTFSREPFSPARTVFAAIYPFSSSPLFRAIVAVALAWPPSLTAGGDGEWAKLLIVPTLLTWILQTLTFAVVVKGVGRAASLARRRFRSATRSLSPFCSTPR
ncbi:MAG: glycosyltransferase [Pyrinomonadaceae bacterium]